MVRTFCEGVVTKVNVDIFYELWIFFVEYGHFLQGEDIFLWSVDFFSHGVVTNR